MALMAISQVFAWLNVGLARAHSHAGLVTSLVVPLDQLEACQAEGNGIVCLQHVSTFQCARLIT